MEGQTDFFDNLDHRPGRYRTPDWQTSKDGAEDIAYRAGTQKYKLLLAFKENPSGLTDEEAARWAGLPLTSCYWKRCGELREDGLIAPLQHPVTKEIVTRTGQAGVQRIVCIYAQS